LTSSSTPWNSFRLANSNYIISFAWKKIVYF
jgi:hypothetical protein